MNLLLTALVLAWGVTPPGIEHVHAGGSDPAHRHEDCQEAADHGSHGHESDDGHHDRETVSDVSLLADCILHLHWRLLGVELTMPMPEKPVEGEDDGGAVPPAIVRVMNEAVPVTLASPSFGRALLAAIRTPSAEVVRSLEPIPCPPNLGTSIPLCDSARLERSGVLLA